MNKNRRLTLKIGALSAGAGLTGITAFTGSAHAVPCGDDHYQAKSTELQAQSTGLGEFSLHVTHSWAQNDIAVVLTNNGSETRSITAVTPLRLSLARGSLDFGKLIKNGPLSLEPGETVEIPLEHKQANVASNTATGYGYFDRSLQQQLKQQVSIVTEDQSVALITVVPGPVVG